MASITASEMSVLRSAHLSPIEKRFARELGCSLLDIEGPPVAMLVGEAPAPNGQGRGPLALFPWPASSSAGRLLKISGMPPGVYLGRFARANLVDPCPDSWSVPAARVAADEMRKRVEDLNLTRVVLLGRRVADAFGIDAFFVRREVYESPEAARCAMTIVAIPHPSGLNPAYNDEHTKASARHELMWAAGLT
jgi:hypothetical protein